MCEAPLGKGGARRAVAERKGKFHGNHKLSTDVKAQACIGSASKMEMWGTKMRLNICLAAAAATLVAATPAVAQQRTATAEARGVVLSPLSLTKVDDLDFGTVAASATLGTVSISPTTGVRTATGGVVPAPSTFSRARFDGLGQAGQTVLLTLTPPTGNVLVSGANTVAVSNMALDTGGTSGSIVIGSGGNFSSYVGADFGIAANQPNGTYSALFTLTADYQ
jgi:hypothetical protein